MEVVGEKRYSEAINQKRHAMNTVKKIGILLLVLVVITGFTRAAGKEHKPDAILQLSGGSIAAGIGFSWGSGTLTYKGKDYPVSVNGLSLARSELPGVPLRAKFTISRSLKISTVITTRVARV